MTDTTNAANSSPITAECAANSLIERLRAMLCTRADRSEDKWLGDGIHSPVSVKELLQALAVPRQPGEMGAGVPDTFARAKAIVETWPGWKRDFTLTPYSASAQQYERCDVCGAKGFHYLGCYNIRDLSATQQDEREALMWAVISEKYGLHIAHYSKPKDVDAELAYWRDQWPDGGKLELVPLVAQQVQADAGAVAIPIPTGNEIYDALVEHCDGNGVGVEPEVIDELSRTVARFLQARAADARAIAAMSREQSQENGGDHA